MPTRSVLEICSIAALFALFLSTALPGASAAEPVVHLEYWHFYGGDIGRLHDRLVETFNREHPGIEVNLSFGGTPWTMRDRLLVALAGDRGPDVASIDQFWISQLAANGHAVKLQPMIESSPEIRVQDISPLYWETARYGGEIWSMPFAASNILLYYNRKLLDGMGLSEGDVPRTWNELAALGEKVAYDRDGDGRQDVWALDMPTLARFGNMYYWIAFLWQRGGALLSRDRTSVAFAGPEGVETLAFWRRLSELGVLTTDPPQNVWDSGRALLQVASSARIRSRYPDLDFSWGVAPLPRDRYRATGLGGRNLAVFTQDSAKQRAAWTFIEWMTSERVNTEWSLGTGYAPLRKSAYAGRTYQEAIAADPRLQLALTEMLYARVRPNIPAYGDVSRELGIAIEEALIQGKEPAQALREAARRSQEIMDRYAP